MNWVTYLQRELAIARRVTRERAEAAQQAADDLQESMSRQAAASQATIAELDAAVVDLEYRNALLTLGLSEV